MSEGVLARWQHQGQLRPFVVEVIDDPITPIRLSGRHIKVRWRQDGRNRAPSFQARAAADRFDRRVKDLMRHGAHRRRARVAAQRVRARRDRRRAPPGCGGAGVGVMAVAAMLSPADIAASLGFEVEAIRRAIRRGELRAVKVCGRLRIEPEWVTDWLQASAVPAAPETRSPAPSAKPSRREARGERGSFRERARRERGE